MANACGFSNVAASLTVAGSKIATSAAWPASRRPRRANWKCCAGSDVIFRIASSSGDDFALPHVLAEHANAVAVAARMGEPSPAPAHRCPTRNPMCGWRMMRSTSSSDMK